MIPPIFFIVLGIFGFLFVGWGAPQPLLVFWAVLVLLLDLWTTEAEKRKRRLFLDEDRGSRKTSS